MLTNYLADRTQPRKSKPYHQSRRRVACHFADTSKSFWRKGWDSNPRYRCRHAGFQDQFLKPLGHPSITEVSITKIATDSHPQPVNSAAGFSFCCSPCTITLMTGDEAPTTPDASGNWQFKPGDTLTPNTPQPAKPQAPAETVAANTPPAQPPTSEPAPVAVDSPSDTNQDQVTPEVAPAPTASVGRLRNSSCTKKTRAGIWCWPAPLCCLQQSYSCLPEIKSRLAWL